MQKGLRLRLSALFIVLCMVMLMVAPAFANGVDAAGRVLMAKPAANAAVVSNFVGFKNVKYETLTGEHKAVQEGLVIRQSRIENGKIIIPKSGLYYTTRTSPLHAMRGEKTLILGKLYTLTDYGTRIDVLKNVEIKKGEAVPFGDGTKRLEVSSISLDDNGFEAPRATLQILKPSGNYYGTPFPVATDPKLIDITTGALKNGTAKMTGSYLPGEKGQNWQVEYYDTPVATSGQSYLVVDEVSKNSVKVKEFATGAFNWMLITDKDPVEMVLAPGETAALGNYTVKVVNITASTATVELIDKDGFVTRKVLGPVTPETMKYMPADELNRNKMIMRSYDDEVQVQLDVFRNPFRNGKVALVGYTDLIKINNPDHWFFDRRFVARPDT
ncbi:hypothetical protein TcarDRAFT_2230 [Thermosinus carboxydivorans Nor1]|uniref:Uncharacterized protein n=1 Tax=Thermosinus carboxydivorans Nor1 TaxID=401526 RepID=A1HNB6_9FIRM|nr:hypothetical protein [Thermosinus carboxydivorans]EAX48280.1 hypothetical protein TcarDRAFT_2230 [Thermosinus carboxydivorans Nor1]